MAHITDQSPDQWSSAGCWPRFNQTMLQLTDVPHWFLINMFQLPACRFQSVSPGAGALVWFSCSQGWKRMVHITGMSCCSNSCCQTSVKLLATFTFQCTTHWHSRALSCCDTRLRTSHHQTWPPNRPDLSSVDYRLLRVIQECVHQKQQATSNIVDELWLLTEWHFINRMTYYISQGRLETPITRGGQLCWSSVANLLSICLPKIIKIQCGLTNLLQK